MSNNIVRLINSAGTVLPELVVTSANPAAMHPES
jgi:hypothetical protein